MSQPETPQTTNDPDARLMIEVRGENVSIQFAGMDTDEAIRLLQKAVEVMREAQSTDIDVEVGQNSDMAEEARMIQLLMSGNGREH